MADPQDNPPVPLAQITYQDLEFDGDILPAAIVQGDGVLLPVRSICHVLGIDARSQTEKIRAHPVLITGIREVRLPVDGRLRVVAALQHRFVPFWLATINPRDIQANLQPKLQRYQEDLVDLLNAIYGPSLPLEPTTSDPAIATLQQRVHELLIEFRLAREALAQQQRDLQQLGDYGPRISELESIIGSLQEQVGEYMPITSRQQEEIARAIRRLAKRYQEQTGKDTFGLLFAEFCKTLGTPAYDKLPSVKYEQAIRWIQNKALQLFPDDADAAPPMQQTLL
jgi:P22_AR N-terminal domain